MFSDTVEAFCGSHPLVAGLTGGAVACLAILIAAYFLTLLVEKWSK